MVLSSPYSARATLHHTDDQFGSQQVELLDGDFEYAPAFPAGQVGT